jgi:hypothetical protein
MTFERQLSNNVYKNTASFENIDVIGKRRSVQISEEFAGKRSHNTQLNGAMKLFFNSQ